MGKILQEYIDEAKRNAKSINTGWSKTLLAYINQLEKELGEVHGKINKIGYELAGDLIKTPCPNRHITKNQKIAYKDNAMFCPPIPGVSSMTCQECEFYRGSIKYRRAIWCAWEISE